MMKGYVCVAGIDPETKEHIRPVLPGKRLRTSLLETQGGPFGMAAIVDLGETRYCGTAPEIEDVEFSLAARVGTLSGGDFWKLLQSVSERSVRDVFGDDLQRAGQTLAIREGG